MLVTPHTRFSLRLTVPYLRAWVLSLWPSAQRMDYDRGYDRGRFGVGDAVDTGRIDDNGPLF